MSEQTTLFESPARFDGFSLPDLSKMVTASAYGKLLQKGEAAGVTVAKDFEDVGIAKASGPSGRSLKFTLSAGSVDRDRDVISPTGLIWEHFEKNPVWLWSHSTGGFGGDATVPLIGVVTEVTAFKSGKTAVKVEYAPKEVNPLAESALQMHLWRLETKALKDRGGAASIGGLPLDAEFNRDRGGVDFRKTEVLEGSDVILPANRDALMRMKAAGVELGPVGDWAERYRRVEGRVELDADRADVIARALDPVRGLQVFELPVEKLAAISEAIRDAGYEPPEEPASPEFQLVERSLATLTAKVSELTQKLENAAAQPAATPPAPSSAEPAITEAQLREAILEVAEKQFIAATGRPFSTEVS